jgi:hypothetical protein
MRLFSWAGWAALATAAVAGYLTNEAIHSDRARDHALPMIGFAEESEFVDRAAPGKLPTLPAEEIDLTCLQQKPPEEAKRQTSEPPLADGPDVLRAIEYRPDPDVVAEHALPAEPELPPPARIPYLTDDTLPAVLPMPEGEDSANAYPVRQCTEPPSGPVWDAVSKFFADAARMVPSGHIDSPPALPGEPPDRCRGACPRPTCPEDSDFINPNLGKPPTGVLPEIREIPDPTPQPGNPGSRQPPTADGCS